MGIHFLQVLVNTILNFYRIRCIPHLTVINGIATSYASNILIANKEDTMNNNSFTNPIIVGRLATEPVFEYKNDTKFTTFKLADDNRGDVTIHNIVTKGKQASLCKQHLHKGNLCCIEGKYNGDNIIAYRVTFIKNSYKD